ncbi:MAG TPA: hypothetical protein V6D21_00255 [Candidatus Obscuribacterales bacterium]
MNELNGQWLDCGGKPCFCPDNSPSPYDYLWDDDIKDIEETEDIEDTKEVIEFREKSKMISRYSSLIEPLEFEIESESVSIKLIEPYNDDINSVDFFTEPDEPF